MQTDYVDIVDTTSDYQSQGSSTYSDPMESYSSTFSSHTSGTTHDEWQESGCVGANGSSFTTSELHSATLSVSYSGTWTDSWSNTTSTSESWSTSWSTPSSYTWSTGTPPTTPLQPPTYNGPSAAAIDALFTALAAQSAAASAQPPLLPAAVDAAILSFQSLDSAPDGTGGGALYQRANTPPSAQSGTGGTGGTGGTTGGGGTEVQNWCSDGTYWVEPYDAPRAYPGWVACPSQGPYHPVGARSDILIWPLGIITYSANLAPPTLGDIVGLDPMLLTNPGWPRGCATVAVRYDGLLPPPGGPYVGLSAEERELVNHCLGNAQALQELEVILTAWKNTPNRFWNYWSGGYCGTFLTNLCARLPASFRDGTTAVKVTPVWFAWGNPSLFSGYLGFFAGPPGHFALRIEFPDRYVVYFDNGWAGMRGIFTFMAGTRVPTPRKFMYGEIATQGNEPGW